MNTWTLSLHWSCLCWRCYHPYIWSAPNRQCPPINTFAAILGFKLSWPNTKLQNVGTGDPPLKILIDGVPVEGVEAFIYFGSKLSSNGYCRLDVLCRIGLACSMMNSLQRVWKIAVVYHHQSAPVPSTGNVRTALWCRNIGPLGRRHTLEAFPHEVWATDTWRTLVGSCLQCRGALAIWFVNRW